MVKHLRSTASTVAVMLLLSGTAVAETFKDPTQPPPEAAMNTSGEPMVAVGPVLQAVTISPQRKSAIISGKEVLLGQKYEDAVLLKINDNQVTLRHPDGSLEVLRMYASVQKTVKTIVPVQSGTVGHGQHKAGKKE